MSQQDLINNLISQQNTSAYAQQLTTDSNYAMDNQMIVSRVVTAKYKVYVMILLVLGVILATNFLPKAWDNFQQAQSQIADKTQTLQTLDQELDHIGQQKQLRKLTDNLQDQILTCVNTKTDCQLIDERLSDNLAIATAYLQLGELSSAKMGVDEKKILRSLDQYLIKNDPADATSTRNGEILSIEIGEEKLLNADEGFYQLPIWVTVVFESKDDLVSFIQNIESFIISNPADRILYHIEELAYDMTASQEEQETQIQLLAYYFK